MYQSFGTTISWQQASTVFSRITKCIAFFLSNGHLTCNAISLTAGFPSHLNCCNEKVKMAVTKFNHSQRRRSLMKLQRTVTQFLGVTFPYQGDIGGRSTLFFNPLQTNCSKAKTIIMCSSFTSYRIYKGLDKNLCFAGELNWCFFFASLVSAAECCG